MADAKKNQATREQCYDAIESKLLECTGECNTIAQTLEDEEQPTAAWDDLMGDLTELINRVRYLAGRQCNTTRN